MILMNMTTEDIRQELGGWGEEYLKHRTGEQQYNCGILFGEREGILKWLTERQVIGRKEIKYEAPAHFYPKHVKHPGELTIVYHSVKDLSAWKYFERKLDLWRELEARRHYAEVKENEGQLGGDPHAWEKEIVSKVAKIRSDAKLIKSF
jgi:hypothetical protein